MGEHYSSDGFDPPAPLTTVEIHNPSALSTAQAVMLIDTGAETSLLPRQIINGLNLLPIEDPRYKLESYDGKLAIASIVYCTVLFENFRFTGDYVVSENTYGIIGRNILNSVAIFLDGPQQKWELVR